MNLLPETQAHRLRKETSGHEDIKDVWHGQMIFCLINAHYY